MRINPLIIFLILLPVAAATTIDTNKIVYDIQNNIVRNVKRIQNMSNTNISEAISLLQQINESDVEMADKTLQKVESLTRSAE